MLKFNIMTLDSVIFLITSTACTCQYNNINVELEREHAGHKNS